MTARDAVLAGAGAAPIDCETAVRRLWDYLDARLSDTAAEEVEAHLAACALCPPHFEFARRMQRALAGARGGPPPTADDGGADRGGPSEAALRARVRSALRRHGGVDGGGH